MKITFMGVGSAFSKKNANSNLLVESGKIKLLIDCGSTASASLLEYGSSIAQITHILITHLHADHIGGLEEFAFMSRLVFKTQPKILGTATLLDRLWTHSLRGGLEFIESPPGDVTPQTLGDFYHPEALSPQKWTLVEEEEVLEIYLHPSNHVKMMESYALGIREGSSDLKKRFIFTGDTKLDLDLVGNHKDHCDLIFHDCQLFDTGEQNMLGVHSSYDQLLSLPSEIRQKIWLYHYGDEELPNATKDGFRGFLQHMQSFEF
ncbi:MBL fold metallo-hydrolase [Deltaproteobacteria bacterium TL4]